MKAAARIPADLPAPDEGRTPESFLAEVQAALNAGSQRGALMVAERGLGLFPYDPELRRLVQALSPRKVRVHPVARPRSDRAEAFAWIGENSWRYRGEWIAVLGSVLVASSPKLSEVLRLVDEADLDERPLLYHVV